MVVVVVVEEEDDEEGNRSNDRTIDHRRRRPHLDYVSWRAAAAAEAVCVGVFVVRFIKSDTE